MRAFGPPESYYRKPLHGGRNPRFRLPDRPASLRRRSGCHRPIRRRAAKPARGQAGADGAFSRPHGRRLGPRLHRLARAAQHQPRPCEGRDQVPPRRGPRPCQGPGDAHDVEVRGGWHPLWRVERRRRGRSAQAEPERARAPHPPLRDRDRDPDRTRKGHPRP